MFDRYVSGTRPSWKRRAVLIGSLGAHGALALGLVVASLFHVAEIAPPLLSVVFIAAPEPAPMASEAKRKQTSKRATKSPTTRTPPTVPQPTAALLPTTPPKSDVPEGPPDDGGPGGGANDGPGPGNGPPGSQGIDPNGFGHGPAMPAPRPRNIGPHQLDAQKIAGADPHLPELVKSQRRGLGDSAFTARICVDQAGSVSRIDVLQGIPGADEAIVQALRGWRYRAQPIPVCFVSRFVFDVQ